MTLHYEDIFSVFLTKITDYSFLEYDESYIREQMVCWLRSASSVPRLRAKFNSIVLDDEVAILTFELKNSVSDDFDLEFVKEVLSRGMVISWIEPQVNNVLLTKQMFGGKEERFFAQANHLKELQSLLFNEKTELSKLLRDYGYLYNSYIKE